MEQYICKVCGHIYDPAYGAPDLGIEPGIPFETLPEDWNCPKCHAAKSEFEPENGPIPGMVAPVGQ
jgi:rubredoxin